MVAILESFLSSSGGATSSDTLIFDKPSGVVGGDLLVIIANNDSTGNPDVFSDNKTDWIFVNTSGNATSDAHIGIFWRISDGTEGATETVIASTVNNWCGFYLRISGHNATTPIDTFNFSSGGVSATHVIPSINTTVDNTLDLYGLSFDGGDGLPFSVSGTGWSQDDEVAAGPGGSDGSATFGHRTLATAGATGDATVTPNTNDGAAYFQLAIAPAVEAGVTVDVPVGSYTYNGLAPTISSSNNISVTVPVGSYTYNGLVPTVIAGGNITVGVPLGSYTYNGLAPTVTAAENKTVVIPTGSYGFSGLAPIPSVSVNKTVVIPTGSYTYSGLAPTALTTENVVVTIPTGSYTYIGLAPNVTAGNNISVDVPTGSYSFTGFAPAVVTVFVPTPAIRTLVVAAENRTVNIIAEDRTLIIPFENRTTGA